MELETIHKPVTAESRTVTKKADSTRAVFGLAALAGLGALLFLGSDPSDPEDTEEVPDTTSAKANINPTKEQIAMDYLANRMQGLTWSAKIIGDQLLVVRQFAFTERQNGFKYEQWNISLTPLNEIPNDYEMWNEKNRIHVLTRHDEANKILGVKAPVSKEFGLYETDVQNAPNALISKHERYWRIGDGDAVKLAATAVAGVIVRNNIPDFKDHAAEIINCLADCINQKYGV